MKDGVYINYDKIPNHVVEKPNNYIFISYSQYSSYKKCPNYWKVRYIDKIKEKSDSINSVFGTAMHSCIQEWVYVLYNESVKAAESFDFSEKFKMYLKDEYSKSLKEKNNNIHFSTKEELTEYYVDGLSILNYLKRKRLTFFDRKNEILIGIEFPLYQIINGVCLVAYLDLLFYNKRTNKYIIKDLKTSKSGWSDWDKKDEIKIAQLIIYKSYLAQKLGISPDDIDIEYVILKRKINESAPYPIPRIGKFIPASGKITQKRIITDFELFISDCFIDGKYNVDKLYPATSGKNEFNCRFCEYYKNELVCPTKNRITI